jgi:outer membrane protein assembly factor BamB
LASPTPAIDGDCVYCSFGTMGTACVRRSTGDVVWRNSELVFDHETGPGSSPIVVDDVAIMHCDGIDQQFIVALDKATGRVVWRQARSGEMHRVGMMRKAFSTPTVVRLAGGPQVLSAAANWLYSYDPKTGKELWKVPYGKLGYSTVPRPVFDGQTLYVCTGFNQSTLLAFDFSGKQELSAPELRWREDTQVPTMPTPLVYQDLVFFVSDRGIATCLDAASGSPHWQERLGGEYSASPILADGKLFFANRDGEVHVVAAEPEFRRLATNQLDAPIFATPAAIDRLLIIRTKDSLYRIEK